MIKGMIILAEKATTALS